MLAISENKRQPVTIISDEWQPMKTSDTQWQPQITSYSDSQRTTNLAEKEHKDDKKKNVRVARVSAGWLSRLGNWKWKP